MNSELNEPMQKPQQIIINQVERQSNSIGTAGFVLSIIAIFLGWIPFLGQVVWFLGLIFSFVGVFRNPKGLSIAGLIISLIGIILLVFVFSAFAAAAVLSK